MNDNNVIKHCENCDITQLKLRRRRNQQTNACILSSHYPDPNVLNWQNGVKPAVSDIKSQWASFVSRFFGGKKKQNQDPTGFGTKLGSMCPVQFLLLLCFPPSIFHHCSGALLRGDEVPDCILTVSGWGWVDTLREPPAHHTGDKHPVTHTLTDISELPTSRNVLNLFGQCLKALTLHVERLQTSSLRPSSCKETVRHWDLLLWYWLLNVKLKNTKAGMKNSRSVSWSTERIWLKILKPPQDIRQEPLVLAFYLVKGRSWIEDLMQNDTFQDKRGCDGVANFTHSVIFALK